jgi:capsular exopolysaccharide synthesis family protein
MSRIHEALKKAAQERTEQLAGRSAQELVEIAGEQNESLPPAQEQTLQQKIATAAENTPRAREYERLTSQCRKVQWNIEERNSVFMNEVVSRLGAERFRTLRSRLYQIAATQPLQSVLVTSSLPAEGKTFVAMNLAQSIVRQADRRVLLVDADLRASRLHMILGATNEPGLSEYLLGEVDETKIIQAEEGGNLCLITGGKSISNPSELLHSERMRGLLKKVAPAFDWIILDSPPALAVHDASMLADMCDGVLFVVRAGLTDYEVAEKACSEFREKRMLGVVLNRAEKGTTYGEYYYGYTHVKNQNGIN